MIKRKQCYIISELSCNHNGSLDEAFKILHMSKEAGADAIKLQTYTADTITRNFSTKPKGTMWEKMDLYSLYKKAYTPWEWQIELKKEADRIGIDFLSSPFDETSVDFLVDELKVTALKVSSFEAVDTKLLEKMAKTGLPILMSNGMMEFNELFEAVNVLKIHGATDITLLQCNSGYPASFNEANLVTMKVMKEIFNCEVGLSDHTLFYNTTEFTQPLPHITPLVAVKLGAKIIEVHVQMDREVSKKMMKQETGGFDWSFSRNPAEFKYMIDVIREYEKNGGVKYESQFEAEVAQSTHGTVCFKPTEKELASLATRPSLWAVKDIKKGERFIFAAEKEFKDTGNFDSIRPGGGLHIRYTDLIQNKEAKLDIKMGTPLDWNMLEI